MRGRTFHIISEIFESIQTTLENYPRTHTNDKINFWLIKNLYQWISETFIMPTEDSTKLEETRASLISSLNLFWVNRVASNASGTWHTMIVEQICVFYGWTKQRSESMCKLKHYNAYDTRPLWLGMWHSKTKCIEFIIGLNETESQLQCSRTFTALHSVKLHTVAASIYHFFSSNFHKIMNALLKFYTMCNAFMTL